MEYAKLWVYYPNRYKIINNDTENVIIIFDGYDKHGNPFESVLYEGIYNSSLWNYAIKLYEKGWEVYQVINDGTYDMKILMKKAKQEGGKYE